MKKYRIRKGSIAELALPIMVMLAMIVITGLGNYYIDGLY